MALQSCFIYRGSHLGNYKQRVHHLHHLLGAYIWGLHHSQGLKRLYLKQPLITKNLYKRYNACGRKHLIFPIYK